VTLEQRQENVTVLSKRPEWLARLSVFFILVGIIFVIRLYFKDLSHFIGYAKGSMLTLVPVDGVGSVPAVRIQNVCLVAVDVRQLNVTCDCRRLVDLPLSLPAGQAAICSFADPSMETETELVEITLLVECEDRSEPIEFHVRPNQYR
jgi:hypothetical protein